MKTVKLSNYLEDSTVGFVGSMSKLFVEDGIPLLRGQNILPFALELTDPKFISSETHAKWKKSALNAGDVVLVRVGHPGTCCVIPEGMGELNAASLVILRTVKEKLDPYFLSVFFNSTEGKRQVDSLTVGSVQSVFNVKTAHAIEIPDFDLLEQRRIVELVKGINDKIELNQKMNQTLEEIAKAIFKSWFVDFDPVRAKAEGRPTGLPSEISDLFPDELVESEIGEIPKGWEIGALGDLFDIQYGKNLPKKNLTGEGYPVFGANGVIGFHSTYLYEEPMTLIGCRGVAGNVGRSLPKSFVTNNSLVINHERARLTSQRFIEFVLASGETESYVTGSAQPQLTIEKIKDFPFITPPSEIVDSFQAIVDPLADRQLLLDSENQVLSELRDTLLPKLISGELRIPDAEKFLEEAGI